MADLSSIIKSSVDDSGLSEDTQIDPTDPVETDQTDAPVGGPELEAAPEAPEAPVGDEPVEAEPTPLGTTTTAQTAVTPADEAFNKKHGLTAREPNGRENRIPYSRVRKITDNAVKEALEPLQKERDSVVQERDAYRAQTTEWESRFKNVQEFERVMVQDKPRFLQLLADKLGYSEIFDRMAQPRPNQRPAGDGMPEPDVELPDGSGDRVYSLDGLKALNQWNREQARKETLAEVDKRFGPIRQEWEANQAYAQAIPVVQRQIAEARQWPLFNESEAEIVQALDRNKGLSLESAYRQVVFPKIQADRDKMRTSLLEEIQKAPTSTAAPVRAVKPAAVKVGPKSLEDIIKEQVQGLK